MPIYVYKGNSQISTNAIRNNKVVKTIYAKEQGKGTVCVWGIDNILTFTYTVTDNKITITGLVQNKEPTSLIIPAQIEGLTVTAIAPNAFKDKNKIKEVVIPNSVKSIGNAAFSGCSSLESMTIPFVGAKAGVTSSDTYQYPFGYIFGTSSYTDSVATKQYYYGNSTSSTTSTTYYIPSSLKSVTVTGGNILRGAFYYCDRLTSITIPNSVTSIGISAFEDCTELTSITIPNSVTSIGVDAFDGCSSLESITIPNSVTNIGHRAFSDCTGLTSVIIGGSVTSIGNYAFYGCRGLTAVTIPNSVTSIGDYAFDGCSGLTTVNWNATACTSAGSFSYPIFKDCSNLATVNIGDNVKIIPSYAFYGCSGLTSITIPNSVTSIGDYAFDGCSGLTSITIPNSVTNVGSFAFVDCTKLTSITISNSVTSIGKRAFYNTVWYNNQPDGLVYAGKVAYEYKGTMPSNTSIVLKAGTLGIGEDAFYYCTGLTSITIPNSVTIICDDAFRICTSLTSITFNGTKAQWNAITKGSDWNYNTGNYTIHCTDGDIPKQ